MEANGLFSGMLGLEMPLHQNPQNPPNPQNPHNPMHQPQMVPYAPHHDPDPHPNPHQSVKQGYPFAPKSKQIALSDDDEPGFGADDKRKISPWQRMKWTDTMVRLLIMAVFYIGDEASDGPDPTGKKKPAGGLLQKKGKWKSVSRAMMEKGFYVSPQQCEDKFNDLNKRYKRVNDILGKGTACRVVENQGLLEKMDLAPKMKEEVRKLLNSKHLFFREMCAYHNSCGHGTVGGASNGAQNSPPEAATEPSEIPPQQQQQQRCFHSSENAQAVANSGRSETEGSKMVVGGSGGEDEDEDDEDDDSVDEDDEEEDEVVGGGCRGQIGHGNHEDDDDNNDERAPRKMARKEGCRAGSASSSQLMQQLSCEMRVVMQDVTKTPWEKQQWLKTRLIQLEEQQVSYQYQAFELEKQRLKWIKYSGKKERDMERAKLENERRRLENERMLLLVRRKELELHHQQQQQQNSSNKRSDPSSLTG